MKKTLSMCLIILLTISLLLTGCGGNKGTTQPAPATEKPKEVFKLKMSHHDPPTSFTGQYLQAWADKIKAKTNGQVEITIFASSSLGAPPTVLDMIRGRVCDLAWCFSAFYPGQFPLTEVITMPMLGVKSSSVGSMVLWDLYTNNDVIKNEFKDFKVLFMHTHTDVPLGTKSKKITKLEDMKGLKIRTPGGPPTEFVKKLGGAPISMGTADIYSSLEKGVIDGFLIDWPAHVMYKLYEQTNEILNGSIYTAPFFVLMNKQVWDSLPPDVQKVFDEESGLQAVKDISATWDKTKNSVVEQLKSSGKDVYTLPPEEAKRWEAAAKEVANEWIKNLEAKGLPAQSVYNKTVELVNKYK